MEGAARPMLVGTMTGLEAKRRVVMSEIEEVEADCLEHAAMCRKYGAEHFVDGMKRLEEEVRRERREELQQVESQLAAITNNVERGKILLHTLDQSRDDKVVSLGAPCEDVGYTSAAARALNKSPTRIFTDSRCHSSKFQES